MRSVKCFVITALLVVLFNTSSYETWAQPSKDSIDRETRTRQSLSTHLAVPNGIRSIGKLPGSQPMELTLTLKLRNPEQLNSLLQDLYNPASPD
jgi:hypothetical protein